MLTDPLATLDQCPAQGRVGQSLLAVGSADLKDPVGKSQLTRAAVPHAGGRITAASGRTVTFQHSLIVDGQVAGTWRLARGARDVTIDAVPLRRLTRGQKEALARVTARYGDFAGVPASLSVD